MTVSSLFERRKRILGEDLELNMKINDIEHIYGMFHAPNNSRSQPCSRLPASGSILYWFQDLLPNFLK